MDISQKIQKLYEQTGISPEVHDFGEKIEKSLKERFDKIDKMAELNQLKVIHAMQEARVNAECFNYASGYGYNDFGRDTLEKVYANVFHTEDALVRPQITCGTHALALTLSANLRPGDELLSIAGKPYDTLEEVIGIRPSTGSLAEYGVIYNQVDLLPDGSFDFDSKSDWRENKADHDSAFQRISDKTEFFCGSNWGSNCICQEDQTGSHLYGG